MQHLPIWRDANRLLVLLEEAVRRFSRYHKYTLGTDLRRQAMGVCRLIMRAYHDKHERVRQVKRLMIAIDDLKLLIQLGKELKAFHSFVEFQQVAELAVSLGKQSGGWLRQLGAGALERGHLARKGAGKMPALQPVFGSFPSSSLGMRCPKLQLRVPNEAGGKQELPKLRSQAGAWERAESAAGPGSWGRVLWSAGILPARGGRDARAPRVPSMHF